MTLEGTILKNKIFMAAVHENRKNMSSVYANESSDGTPFSRAKKESHTKSAFPENYLFETSDIIQKR